MHSCAPSTTTRSNSPTQARARPSAAACPPERPPPGRLFAVISPAGSIQALARRPAALIPGRPAKRNPTGNHPRNRPPPPTTPLRRAHLTPRFPPAGSTEPNPRAPAASHGSSAQPTGRMIVCRCDDPGGLALRETKQREPDPCPRTRIAATAKPRNRRRKNPRSAPRRTRPWARCPISARRKKADPRRSACLRVSGNRPGPPPRPGSCLAMRRTRQHGASPAAAPDAALTPCARARRAGFPASRAAAGCQPDAIHPRFFAAQPH